MPKSHAHPVLLRLILGLALAVLPALHPGVGAQARACTPEDVSAAVDTAGERLRAFNAQNAPILQERLRQLQGATGWSDFDMSERASGLMETKQTAELDRRANESLSRIDTLGTPSADGDNCETLAALNKETDVLLAIMREKTELSLARIDAEIAMARKERQAAAKAAPPTSTGLVPGRLPAAAPPPANIVRPAPQARLPAPATAPLPVPRLAPPSPERSGHSEPWQTTTAVDPATAVPPQGELLPTLPPDTYAASEEGYTIEEIRDATRGFFGTVSTGLGSVIEYAFQRLRRPSAYVLGKEGGGAFLAGVRYGEGTLFPRNGPREKIWWHGPTLGYDFGAAGSRTMFLIYRMKEPSELYRRYTGVDGSAYLIGGVGITFLTDGNVIMAPIRSGVGLRIGANIGYVRFTSKRTWNPF